MKKILFAAYSLDIGGIEKALVTLINALQKKEYEITLVLEKKQGIFLDEINKKVKILEYRPSKDKNIIIRKMKNLVKRIEFICKNRNKFDFSASFATYSKPSSFVSRIASKNSYLWVHSDYLTIFENQKREIKKFFEGLKYNKFKKIIFVSRKSKDNFVKVFPNYNNIIVCNNLIDGEKIVKLAKEKIECVDLRENKEKLFVNVGRHSEKEKKLSRIIEASERLKKEGYNFKVLMVGEGKDTEKYKKEVKEKELEEMIIFLGKKENPYPYFKISDCVILTSDYEGYPVVFLESYILHKPIITTKVSDYEDVEDKYGMIAEKNIESIYEKMKKFIEEGFEIKEKFDYVEYNKNIINIITDLIEGK